LRQTPTLNESKAGSAQEFAGSNEQPTPTTLAVAFFDSIDP